MQGFGAASVRGGRSVKHTAGPSGRSASSMRGFRPALAGIVAVSLVVVVVAAAHSVPRTAAFCRRRCYRHRQHRRGTDLPQDTVPKTSLPVERNLLPSFRSDAASSSSLRLPNGLAMASSTSTVGNSRSKQIQRLSSWSKDIGIQIAGVEVQHRSESSGLGVVNTRQIPKDSVVMSVPSSVAITVESGVGPDDVSVLLSSTGLVQDRRAVRGLPWFAQFSLYLHKLDKVNSRKTYGRVGDGSQDDKAIDLRPWLDSLPRRFDTPLHWSKSDLEKLQYDHMTHAVKRQNDSWKQLHRKLTEAGPSVSWKDFVWGCEIARSRAFSSGYGGSAFNPSVYLFTLVLVVGYLGLNLGTIEQAANGAALVVCASILRDFVLPKVLKTKKYVICPVIDMCNHRGIGYNANVAFEFFADAYSLSSTTEISDTKNGAQEVYISYGDRSNDQLLQYYGFVEPNNPNDVYVMPPLRSWDIAAIEEACGGPFAAGRLAKLENAGLLGKASLSSGSKDGSDDDDDGVGGNPLGGVVLTRADGMDPAVIQALRVLVATDEEWSDCSEAVGNFATAVSAENERRARLAAETAIAMELSSKPTTLDEDETLLRQLRAKKGVESEDVIALAFRIEKKKILKEALGRLK